MLDHGLKTRLPVALLALVLGGPMTAHAADLYVAPGPYRTPAPYPAPYEPPPVDAGPGYEDQRFVPPMRRQRYGGEFERCRFVHRVWVDPYGRQVMRPVQVCAERAAMHGPRWVAAPPAPYGYGPGPAYGPPPMRDVPPPPEFNGD